MLNTVSKLNGRDQLLFLFPKNMRIYLHLLYIFEEQVKTGTINQKQVRSEEDPRNIAPNIAMEPRLSVKQLLGVRKSRF